ncbi:hypothetical protein NHF50_05480 [Flavobacterium sp. NRK F10]|uniref:hypothetical protein n=1 Tax=Flavobacterium sp. NRK F10 TaxID=2954931 RepID=UPI0020909E8F|nr:hypothetical protein [Flavobacterium sp. NRK F10]MCO6174489.1 hypothetical protein [Flavobacterium sp. NRK F10]
MKKKHYSYYELKINSITIGYSTNLYHYYLPYSSNLISTEIIPYPISASIENLKIKNNYPTYKESVLTNSNQDILQTEQLLKEIFLNLEDFEVEIIEHRTSFILEFIKEDEKIKVYLVHEKNIEPNYKQIQFLNNDDCYKYNIAESDIKIVTEIRELLNI